MSNDAVQSVDEISPASEELEEWVVNIEARLLNPFPFLVESSQTSTDRNSEEKPSIYYVIPEMFQFHTFTDAEREFLGFQFLAFMKQWFGLNVRSYLQYMQVNEDLARGYYNGLRDLAIESQLCTTIYFLECLLLNSCVIIFAIVLFQNVRNGVEILTGINENWSDPSYQRSREFNILYQYIMKDLMGFKCSMLLMKHQIPWFVVEAVYTKHSNLSKLVGAPINILAVSCFDDFYPRVHKSKTHGGTVTLPPGGFKHLLHLFHWTRTPEGMFLVDTRSLQPIRSIDSFYIPSATELQLSATVFEKHSGDSVDVSYSDRRLSGVMQLAPFYVFSYSLDLYKNLIDFERIYVNCGFSVTAYVACMATLLQTKEDVQLLRANGIIPSTGRDEKTVLGFVADLKEALYYKPYMQVLHMPNDLNILSEKVRAHNERTSSRSYAELKSRYCANTWITISVIAGIILFGLTFIQTIYGTLSYYKQ